MTFRLHPLTQVCIALWFSGLAIISVNPALLLILLLLCIVMLTVSRSQTLKALGGSLLRILPLVLMIMLIQMLATRNGPSLLKLGVVTVHSQGLVLGAALGLRVAVILLAAKLLTRLTPMDFDAAFRALKLPEEVGFMVSYAVHLLPGIHSLLTDTRRTAQKRGIDLKRLKLRQKIRLYAIIALRLVSELLQGSELRAIALELRGFRSQTKTSRLHIYRFGWRDLASGLALMISAAGLLYIQQLMQL